MEMVEMFFRIQFIVAGIFLLGVSFMSLVKKHLTEGFALAWALGAVFILMMGIVPGLSNWTTKLSMKNMFLFLTLVIFLMSFMFWACRKISQLMMETHELAMQVSLLNQENEKIMRELHELVEYEKKEAGHEEKGADRH